MVVTEEVALVQSVVDGKRAICNRWKSTLLKLFGQSISDPHTRDLPETGE